MDTVRPKTTSEQRELFQIIRVAVTGSMVSLPLFESLELLGKDKTLKRLAAARELCYQYEEGER